MIITAHTGADHTPKNTRLFLSKMKKVPLQAIEMDIRKSGNIIYCKHDKSIMPFLKLRLKYVLDYVVKRNILINLDLKSFGLVKDVAALVKACGAENNVYYTGSVGADEFEYLGKAKVYLNLAFIEQCCPLTVENVGKIKEYVDSFKCENVGGINVNYKFASEELLSECKKQGLKVSLFTVDDIDELKRLLNHDELVNITTKKISCALSLANQIRK